MDYAFCLLTLKSYEKWRSPLFGATCNFNDQILPYGILFLTFINTNVFYLLCDVMQSVLYIIAALLSCNFIIKNYVNCKITSYIYLLIFTKSLWLHVKHFNPRMDYAFCLLTLKSYEKWRSPLFGATCNFNDQILPYGILFLTFINTNVFYLLSFKFSR
jgi:putative component of membrane protein insertase Oxa1/YidC/SpoIIIJ protein YidD